MKKKMLSIMALTTGLLVFNIDAKALTTREVGNVEDYFNTIEEIHNTENDEFVIKLTDDIVVSDASVIKNNNNIDNGNTVRVLGQGHTFKCTVSSNCRLSVSGNGKLYLGAEDGTDELTLEGTGTDSDDGESLVSVSNGQAHMFDGVTLTKNVSSTAHLTGGGVRVGDNGKFYMHGGTIKENSSSQPGLGGAVMVDGSQSYFEMSGGEISDNYAAWYGGGIYQGDGEIKITGGTIKNNSSSIGGAGLASMGGKITIDGATFEDNEAKTDMGYGYGGAILVNYDSSDQDTKPITISVTNTEFKNNKAKFGGGMCNSGVTGTILTNNTFTGNTASSYAGGLYLESGSITSTNNKYINNTGTSYAGGIMSNGDLVSNNDKVTSNTARIGAGMVLYAGTADLSTANISNNKASTQANDLYISSSLTRLSVNAAENMKGYATFDNTNVSLKNWYKDGGTRYSLSNPTDVVSTFEAGNSYSVTVSGNEANVVTFNISNKDVEEQAVEIGDKAVRPENPTMFGKRFDDWYTTSAATTKFDFDAVISEDTQIYANWNDLIYEFTEGNEQELDKTDDGSFTIDADYDVFLDGGKVYVDGVLVDSSNYTSEAGSTIINLNKDFLDTLALGEHTIRVEFTDGGYANATFDVVETSNGNGSGNPNSDPNSNSNSNSTSNIESNSNSTSNVTSNTTSNIESNSNSTSNVTSNTTSNSNKEVKNSSEKNPKTGDNIISYIVLFIMSATALVITKFKKKHS